MIGQHLKEIYQYRDLLKNLVTRDLTVRYKRSILGFFWTMVNPSANALVLTIIFSTIFQFQTKDFILYFLSGFLLWTFFASSTIISSRCLMGGSAIFKKIYVPKSIFVISVICSEMVNFFLASITLLLLTLIMRHSLPLSLLFWPVSFLLIILFTLGVALLLSATSIFFYDIIEGYQILLMPWMYLTPIMYPIEIIPPQYQIFIKLNPMYYYVECFRIPLYVGQLPGWDVLTVAIAISFISLLLGYKAFNRLGDDFIFYV
jgi:ABC-type polysaccharide/polyol phosphate export permease